MNKRTILHVLLWVAAVASFGMSGWAHYQWKNTGGNLDDPTRSHWMIYAVIGVICIVVWFFTREKEEEISITRG